MEKFKTFAPLFEGFYGTVFEYSRESDDVQSYNDEHKTTLSYDDFEWDYADYHNRVSKAFVSRIETELRQFLPITIVFEELVSPREYNFTNDSINVEIECDLKTILSLITERKEMATQYFKERYTSRSGFIPFHSNDIEDWLNEDYIREKPEHRIGALLDCLCSIEIGRDDLYYWADNEYWINYSAKAND